MVAVPGGGLWASFSDNWACGMHGCGAYVLHSPDGGRTWALADAPAPPGAGCGPESYPWLAAAPSGSVVAAVYVSSGACLPPFSQLSRWDGSSWAPVHDWDLGTVAGLAWPSAADGYVLVGRGLARTTDSGRTWSQSWPAPAPVAALAAESSTLALAGGDATDQGAVLQTTDGGKSWSQLAELPGQVLALSVPTRRDAFVILFEPTRYRWELEVSNDGGRHWYARGPLPQPRPFQLGDGPSGLWMASASSGLLLTGEVGDVIESATAVAPFALWSTTDGGRSWQRVARVPSVEYSVLGAAGFALLPSGPWWGVIEEGSHANEVTLDGGRHWQDQPGFPSFEGAEALAPGTLVGWSTTASGAPYMEVSTDAGRRWARRLLPRANALQWPGTEPALFFTNRAEGRWETSGQVWTTGNGGRTWSEAT